MVRNISKNLTSKYSQKIIDHAKKSATDTLKTSSRRVIRKSGETTSDLNGNKLLIKFHEPQKLHQRKI